jgi:hypothetical protein
MFWEGDVGNEEPLKPLWFKGLGFGGIKWARTIDLHDVNG